ncbi:MAG: hypothetical protein SH820_07850 [Xanthomonadales bacterium]|nr:hypothetical protein [Xanthomonadales bacterium]
MNRKSSTAINSGIALALASFVWANGAMAQDNKLVNMDRPADNAASCEKLNWHEEFVTTYPWASEACHSVVLVNGEKWARFEGKFLGLNDDGSFDTEFLNTSNTRLGSVELMPTSDQRVSLDGTPTRFADLERGQILSFYVPEGAIGFAIEPGVPSTQYVRVVEPSNQAKFAAADDTPEEAPVVLAQADPQQTRIASDLPNTAGPLPLIALGGLMSLFGGLGLTFRRKLSKRTS